MQAPLCWTYLLHQDATGSLQATTGARAGQKRVSTGHLTSRCRNGRLTAGSSTASWKHHQTQSLCPMMCGDSMPSCTNRGPASQYASLCMPSTSVLLANSPPQNGARPRGLALAPGNRQDRQACGLQRAERVPGRSSGPQGRWAATGAAEPSLAQPQAHEGGMVGCPRGKRMGNRGKSSRARAPLGQEGVVQGVCVHTNKAWYADCGTSVMKSAQGHIGGENIHEFGSSTTHPVAPASVDLKASHAKSASIACGTVNLGRCSD
jgi:hypothetical protein